MTNSEKKPVVIWFRQDLRLHDNPALVAAHESGHPVLPLYILDDHNSAQWRMGGASRWWLHESLGKLNISLNKLLCFRTGDPLEIIKALVETHDVQNVFWNRCYEPWRIGRDKQINDALREFGVQVQTFNGSLLFDPEATLKEDGTPYKVFTPFFKKGCLERAPEPSIPVPAPKKLKLYSCNGMALDELNLLPKSDWHTSLQKHWQPGEEAAVSQLEQFLDAGLCGYKSGRDFPCRNNVSRLSPYLHFGEISPRTVWHAVKQRMLIDRCEEDGQHFLSELGWREFSNNLLVHFPTLPEENLQKKFDRFPWRNDTVALESWQMGHTGYPIVDAGMQELWQTGYMHNRVRMIVGSFLVKNLLLHWRQGEEWFWDTLVDADLANNSASWQWVAGCGADAAPYFRIFNPVTQGKKFDPEGKYVKRFLPALAELPEKYVHCPWEAPDELLSQYGISLGENYPKPIVDLKASRERALDAFAKIRGQTP